MIDGDHDVLENHFNELTYFFNDQSKVISAVIVAGPTQLLKKGTPDKTQFCKVHTSRFHCLLNNSINDFLPVCLCSILIIVGSRHDTIFRSVV